VDREFVTEKKTAVWGLPLCNASRDSRALLISTHLFVLRLFAYCSLRNLRDRRSYLGYRCSHGSTGHQFTEHKGSWTVGWLRTRFMKFSTAPHFELSGVDKSWELDKPRPMTMFTTCQGASLAASSSISPPICSVRLLVAPGISSPDELAVQSRYPRSEDRAAASGKAYVPTALPPTTPIQRLYLDCRYILLMLLLFACLGHSRA
jgi:hypothetical protein